MTNAELKALELLKEAAVEFPSLAMKEIIAQFNNVEVYQVDMTDINQELSGVVQEKDGKYYVYVNAKDSDGRKRFTIAHELGHIVLGHVPTGGILKDNLKFRDPTHNYTDEEKKQEVEANDFAANLLMPSEAVQKNFSLFDTISELAKFFNVSEQAMRFRLDNLGLTQC
ncbi:MAG: ImmA/IrrE family metallo-endopeptidase [Candidatus Absconditabacterales bacterium]